MARIGFKPVVLPAGVTTEIKEGAIVVKGPKGELNVHLPQADVSVEVKGGAFIVNRLHDEKQAVENHGTVRANIANAVKGVTEGYKKELEINGIGYRAEMKGTSIVLHVGFSHEVVITPVEGVKITAKDETHIVVEGIDKQKVGQTAALIHDTKRPEPMVAKASTTKAKHLIRKEGKRAAATGGKK